jgi:release factor glutamine methyltransferase
MPDPQTPEGLGSRTGPPKDLVVRLRAAGCVAAEEEAAELAAAAPDDVTRESWTRRREAGEPLAWITGTITFCGHRLHIDPGVYVPRPQTEELASRAARLLAADRSSRRAVDACTGSGAVAFHLAYSVAGSAVVGVDTDPLAVRCATTNGLLSFRGDLCEALAADSFDVVTAVAPYVPRGELRFLPTDTLRYEPISALDGGTDGLETVRRVVASAARVLRDGGWLLLEIGGSEDEGIHGDLDRAGFSGVSAWYDDDGDLRGIQAQLSRERCT